MHRLSFLSFLSFLFLFPLPSLCAQVTRTYRIINKCPKPATLFISGVSQGVLPANGGTVVKVVDNNFDAFIYTDVNGGNQDGSGTTRAGFFGEASYYYIVVDPNHLNVGVSIDPSVSPHDGFCGTDTCNSLSCLSDFDAFSSPPVHFFPGPALPSKPMFACVAGSGYDVTFCPDGAFPGLEGRAIHPNGNSKKCLDVRGAVFADGTPVQIYDCNGSNAQKWIVQRGNTKVQLAGTNFCLDASADPHSGTKMKIWQCYNNLPAQAWYYTNDNRIALTGRGQCLDLTNGVLTNGNPVQIWKCTNGNTNQIWTV